MIRSTVSRAVLGFADARVGDDSMAAVLRFLGLG